MKRIALATLLFCPLLIAAADKPVLPPDQLAIKIKGLPDRACTYLHVNYSEVPMDILKDTIRNGAAGLGFDAANAYFPPPLTKEQEKYRDFGRQIMAAAPYIAFPELGDSISKSTPAVAYCSSSVGDLNVWESGWWKDAKVTGRGKCEDFMVIYLRPSAK